jgi:hypothetical protein
MTDTTSIPSSVPTSRSFSVEKDDTENILNKFPARPLLVLPNEFVLQDIGPPEPGISDLIYYYDQAQSIILESPGSVGSGLDWIVPVVNKVKYMENYSQASLTHSTFQPMREKTVGERLDPTLLNTITEKKKYALKAKWTSYALNVAIGLQVLLGTLTTGLSVATTGRQVCTNIFVQPLQN